MKNKIFLTFTLLLLVLAGCKESFFDINENPNNPVGEVVEPRLLLPSVLNATAKKMAVDYDFLAQWMGYWSRGADYGQSLPLESYNLTTSYEQNNWVNGNTSVANPAISWYDILNDADKMEKKAAELNQPFYAAAAKVVKSIGFMYLVDMYNNVPYSQAFDVDKYITPEYDKGQDIYKDLLLQLDAAKDVFQNSTIEQTQPLQASDIMFHGDLAMWIRLVNTQRLKLLLRQSQVLGSVPTSELSKMEGGFLMSGQTASINPGYANNKYQQNPFYAAFYLDFTGSVADGFNRANVYLLNKYRDNNDPRYKYVFRAALNPVDDEYNPVEPDEATDEQLYRGTVFGARSNPNMGSVNQSMVAGPGLVDSPTQDLWFFTSVESMFLQAEAYQRGWLTGKTPQTAYNDAIRESFLWLGVDDPGAHTQANAYIASGASIVAWNSANPLQSIITQKYIALAGINNFESWADYRRLGLPADVPLSINANRGSRNIPLRLLYPQNEYSFNAKNVNAQGTIDAQTSRVFWDVN